MLAAPLRQATVSGVSGVSSANLAAINSALASAPVVGSSVDSTAKVQALVNAYNAILALADGSRAHIFVAAARSDDTAVHGWDKHWWLSIMTAGGLVVSPAQSMVENVGFGGAPLSPPVSANSSHRSTASMSIIPRLASDPCWR